MRVEAAVEGGEVAAEREQLVELGEDRSLGEDVAALLAGELVEGAVVALGDADVGVVDDAHHHVGARSAGWKRARTWEARARRSASVACARGEGVFGRDALAGVDLCGYRVGCGVGEAGHLLIVWRRSAIEAEGADSPSEAKAPAARSVGFASFGRSRLVLWATWLPSTSQKRDLGHPAY